MRFTDADINALENEKAELVEEVLRYNINTGRAEALQADIASLRTQLDDLKAEFDEVEIPVEPEPAPDRLVVDEVRDDHASGDETP